MGHIRWFSAANSLTEGEQKLIEILKTKFTGAKQVSVQDISGKCNLSNFILIIIGISLVTSRGVSGGCGSMYEVTVEAEEFRGKRIVQQHKLVTEVHRTTSHHSAQCSSRRALTPVTDSFM